MRNAEILSAGFSRREKSFHDFLKESPERGGDDWVDLVLRFHPTMRPLAEEVFSQGGQEVDGSGRLVVNVRMPENGWLYGSILSWGEFVEVLSPASIRAKILSSAGNIADFYKKDFHM